MAKNIIKSFLNLYFVFAFLPLFGQQKCELLLQFPHRIEANNIEIFYNNGLKEKKVEKKIIKGSVFISDSFYSKYATVVIRLKDSSKQNSKYEKFFINEGPAKIIFTDLRLSRFKTKNAFGVEQISKNYLHYVEPLQKKFDGYLQNHPLDSMYFELFKDLIHRKIDFIKNNNKEYYSFQVFKNEIVPITFPMTDGLIDSLYFFYSITFSNELRETMEGKMIEKKLISKLVATHDNIKAPDFVLTDISGNTINMQNCKGKFILLDFWASWCVPCVEELPAIRRIFESYSSKELVIISISYDKDSLQFLQAIDKYNMKWINIYRDETIAQDYGGRVFLPKLFLIDPDGIIIYNIDSNRQLETSELELLNTVLKKKVISKK